MTHLLRLGNVCSRPLGPSPGFYKKTERNQNVNQSPSPVPPDSRHSTISFTIVTWLAIRGWSFLPFASVAGHQTNLSNTRKDTRKDRTFSLLPYQARMNGEVNE